MPPIFYMLEKELIEHKTVTLTVSDLDITLGPDSLGRERPARFVDIGAIDVGIE